MVTKLKEVDVVVVGLGWTGGILSKELAEAGLKVVALERGAMRSTEKDYSVPNIRDELRYVVRHDLMQNTARDTITVRNSPSQEALPMRRLGSFLPGEVVGGSAVHWSGHTWRWTDMEFKVRSNYEQRYGKTFDRLTEQQREEVLVGLSTAKIAFDNGLPVRQFWAMLYQTVMEGMFSDPIYGGNRNKAGWRLIGFPGLIAVHRENVEKYRDKKFPTDPLGIADMS